MLALPVQIGMLRPETALPDPEAPFRRRDRP